MGPSRMYWDCPETFDVGTDTNSPLANDYFDLAPLRFEGELTCVS
jgi:hypothetical protein